MNGKKKARPCIKFTTLAVQSARVDLSIKISVVSRLNEAGFRCNAAVCTTVQSV